MIEEVRKDANGHDPADSNRRIADFVSSFRETKHYLLNSLAIWIAQAQVAQRHPEYYEKLADSIVERSERLLEITHEAEEKLRAFAPYPSIPPPGQSQVCPSEVKGPMG